MIENMPRHWDAETGMLAIGSGIGGMSAAITAHDFGAQSVILERSKQVGGVTALSMGEVWVAGNHHAAALGIKDSPESGFRYLKRLSMGYGRDAAILNLVVHAREALRHFEARIGLQMEVIRDCPDYYYGVVEDSVAEGRLLEVAPFAAEQLGDWRLKTRLSPQMPYGLTHRDMFRAGGVANMVKWDFNLMGERLARDVRCLGPGLAAYFVQGVIERGIPMHTDSSAEEIICDGKRVVGVRARRDGGDWFIKANRGVVIAVSSYERQQEFNRSLSQQLQLGSMVFSTVDGAGFRLAGPLGAQIARVPDITSLGFLVPGEEDEEGAPLWRSALPVIGQPHTIVVNRRGKRFGNEAFYRSFYYSIDSIDGADQTHPNFPCWVLIDSQVREKYPFGPIAPGQEWPKGLGVTANSVRDLAQKLGMDADSLADTVASFNAHAERGEDPEFGRGRHPWSVWICGDPFHKPNANLGPLVKPPFYAVELKRMGGTGIPPTGLLTDQHSRVLGWDDRPIEGLYAAGNSAARMETGAVMQSGISNARGMTHGWLAARHACGHASDALVREAGRLRL